MAWSPRDPEDFSRFRATDMIDFLAWFEVQFENVMSLGLINFFVEGVVEPHLEALARGNPPSWLKMLLRLRMAAQWTYELGVSIASKARRSLQSLIPDDRVSEYADRFRITPQDIANIPPAIRSAFVEGARFSLSWIKRLTNDGRDYIRLILSAETLKNRNPANAVPLLEQILRRDLIARTLGMKPEDVTPEMVAEWSREAQQKTIKALTNRASAIANTESMRMLNLGVFASLEEQGMTRGYVMPHANTCPDCERLIDGRVFDISVLRENMLTNFGKPSRDWIAAIPQHPNCRHSLGPIPVKFRKAIAAIKKLPPEGVMLEWYGLPGGKTAMEALGLPEVEGWLAA